MRQGRGAVRNYENLLKDAEEEAEAERQAQGFFTQTTRSR